MKVLSEEMMTEREYHQYVIEECERQWNECQKEEYGEWYLQSDDTQADYYNDMYSHLIDGLGKACCDCCYLGEDKGRFYCNFGDSENYGKEVQARNYCDEFDGL